MNNHELQTKDERHDLTDSHFYQQAGEYFKYHAEQRTTMINYFIAVFGVALGLYGTLIKDYAVAGILLALFLIMVSLLFFMIDLRTKFDIKQSESVLRQFEHIYEMDRLKGAEDEAALGVFSNEKYVYEYYGYGQRKRMGKTYQNFRNLYKKMQRERRKEERKMLDSELKTAIDQYLINHKKADTISVQEVYESLGKGFVIPLSFSIKMLYLVCMAISVLAFVFAVLIACGVV